mmetsp:Transcript_41370/g.105365  ORF Transcript_41370/g.105365 Transcript_41370/m.105365 type:complete len:206 (+) Transcript_41370:50-667(+)
MMRVRTIQQSMIGSALRTASRATSEACNGARHALCALAGAVCRRLSAAGAEHAARAGRALYTSGVLEASPTHPHEAAAAKAGASPAGAAAVPSSAGGSVSTKRRPNSLGAARCSPPPGASGRLNSTTMALKLSEPLLFRAISTSASAAAFASPVARNFLRTIRPASFVLSFSNTPSQARSKNSVSSLTSAKKMSGSQISPLHFSS